MNIYVFAPEYWPPVGGGIANFYQQQLPFFVRAGHKVRVFQGSGVSAHSGRHSEIIEGVQIDQLEIERLDRSIVELARLRSTPTLARHLAAASAMWKQAGEGADADVIEACDWGLSFLPAVLSGKKPVVVQAHGSIGQIDQHDPIAGEAGQGVLTRLIEVAGMQRATEIQAYSRANAEFWKRQTDRDVRAILPAWRPPQALTDAPPPSADGLVLGRVQSWKGPRVLCEALRLLGARAPRMDWVGRDMAAGRRERSCSAMLAEEFPDVWGSRVRHLPQVAPETAAQLQRAVRFNLVPSTWDTFNFTCVEAMASGRPVICSTGAGASELIEDGVNGFLFDYGDAHALANAIDRVLSLGQTETARLAEAARETVLRGLDPERIASIRLKRYEDTIANFKSRPAPADDWLREVCSGGDALVEELAFLDHLPLRPLLKYGGRRLASKLTGIWLG